jgi:hypothetical protein
MNDIEQLKKTYQKSLIEMQNDIDNLQRNCDCYYEQMNDAVERTIELNVYKDKYENLVWFLQTSHKMLLALNDGNKDNNVIGAFEVIMDKINELEKVSDGNE